MKRLVAGFFGITFLLVIIQISLIGFVSLTTGISFSEALAESTIYDVHEIQIGNQTQVFWIFNAKRYLFSIRDSITVNFEAFKLDPPNWPKTNWADILGVLKTIVNFLIYIVNWLILIVNATVLLPTKLLLTPIIFLIAILGIDISNVTLLNAFQTIYGWNISYIDSLS